MSVHSPFIFYWKKFNDVTEFANPATNCHKLTPIGGIYSGSVHQVGDVIYAKLIIFNQEQQTLEFKTLEEAFDCVEEQIFMLVQDLMDLASTVTLLYYGKHRTRAIEKAEYI